MPAVKSRPCASGWIVRGVRWGAGTGGLTACQPPFPLDIEQHDADVLITAKHSHRNGFQIIKDQLTYGSGCRSKPAGKS